MCWEDRCIERFGSLCFEREMNDRNIWREAAAGNVNQVIHLSRSVGVDAVDQWGWTPLHWACKKNHPLLVTELLRSRANPTILDLV